jgi:ABC-type Fe3+/spermidine/putrescine transport system ATPase subunit
MPMLELMNLCKSYGKVAVVKDVNLQLERGELVTLLGPSGCGKTTTLRMIAGFIEPTAGTILVNGQELSAPGKTVSPEHRGMSMIFQSYAIWPNMTVAENVAFGLSVRKIAAAEVQQRVAQMLDVVKLGPLAQRYPAELSGGQQQRVALARAMIVRPEVLLLDEPLSNLDANLREEMAAEIRRLHDEFHFTTVYVTHDQAEAMTISDRIAVLSQGRLEQIDTPWNLYNRPRTPFVAGFIGKTNLLSGTAFDGRLQPQGSRSAQVSVRPQSLFLGHAPAGALSLGVVQVKERTYLGEVWNYVVQAANDGVTLKVHAPPTTVFKVGQEVQLSVDLEGIACVG